MSFWHPPHLASRSAVCGTPSAALLVDAEVMPTGTPVEVADPVAKPSAPSPDEDEDEPFIWVDGAPGGGMVADMAVLRSGRRGSSRGFTSVAGFGRSRDTAVVLILKTMSVSNSHSH